MQTINHGGQYIASLDKQEIKALSEEARREAIMAENHQDTNEDLIESAAYRT